jgi:CRP-like cAMP-binding protein
MPTLQPIELVNQRLHHEVEKYGEVIQFEKKQLLFSPQEMQEKFFFLLEGRIKVSQVNLEDGKEQTLKILTSGDMYDVVTLLDGKVHENILEAIDNVKLIVFPIAIVRGWMKEDTQFNQLLFPYIAQQFRDMEELALDLSFYDTSKRLLKLISKNIDQEKHGKPSLIHNLPHEELAALIGTVRKVLNRHIQKLKKDGIIDVSRKNIEIKDTQKLLDNLPIS